jgi:hypothetical protein
MEELAQEFVRRRGSLRQAGLGIRVPEELRRLAVRFGRWAQDEGESLGEAAVQLGVSRATLERWLAEEPAGDSSAVREVVVREEEAGGGGVLTLVTPEGFRIEGLAVADLAVLVRSLRR